MQSLAQAPADTARATSRAPGQRERAKDGRRRRIVQAAHDLLRSEAPDSLSGRTIAAHAGVSLSTVYNLFGSKDAVLEAVYAEDLAAYEELVRARASRDTLERLFDAVDVAVALYRADPDFYRATMVRRPAAEPLDQAMRQPRNRFWEGLVLAMQADGFVRADADGAALARVLVYQFSGALGEWVAGDLALDRFARDIAFGFAATLMPFATPQAETRLRRVLAASQGECR